MTSVSVATLLAACAPSSVTPEPATESVTIGPEVETQPLAERAGAPLFDGMGSFTRTITTSDPDAQRYFDQGMVLAFGFNHAEANRSFRAAQTLDPSCAMCFWGEALATGPNINVTADGKAVMSEADQVSAYAALEKARALAPNASELEQDMIAALATRYSAEPVEDRFPYDLAYADAMEALSAKYPEDDDIASMAAEARMNTMPWDYWSTPTTPRPKADAAITSLETVIARSPDHALALHLYIHAVEASDQPELAEPAADLLADLVPGSGHLVHMPAHIYWRVGRYEDAATANIKAAKVDEDYIAACNAQGFYPALYYPHNIHFLWASASMMGQSELALEQADKLAANVSLEMIDQFPTVEFFHTIPLLTKVQFAKWDELLKAEQPRADLAYSNAIWHYARGVAMARSGNLVGAETEYAAMSPLIETDKVMLLDGADYPASALLTIAQSLLAGELSMAAKDFDAAISHFGKAVALQDGLPYTEPPFWYYPSRQSLGEALMAADKYADAEAVYRTDLADYPKNGWSTFGLMAALEAQGKTAEAERVSEQFEILWQMADVELESSRL
ncbi:MAG: hypothetical protein CMK07_07955 [Ponticaulis sp.]|nr:hypothetical protein [Ponticaulis sp.]